jgi:aminocarboxymuconate-semialdehyde decarboxylase
MLDYDLWIGAGFLLDGALATLRLAYRGVFEENLDLNFIVPHLGTFLLSGWDRLQLFSRRAREAGYIRRPVGDYLRGLYYDSVNTHAPFWTCAIDTVGPDHIVFGTDYPFTGPDSVAEGIARIQRLDITPSQREAIFSGTADRILRP